ncbi:MAG: NAD(+)--dinitrogen-reductase ADP-D-ribosyltransferase [Ignavibacteria bacterium]
MTERDATPAICRNRDNAVPSLPAYARVPINRCNLPAVILGSLTFQRNPTALALDGVAELHDRLFDLLDRTDTADEATQLFRDYIAAHFRLDNLEDAGLDGDPTKRAKANWIRALRGWSFDSDGREAAVLKGWVESRFGLVPRFHGEPLRDFSGPAWRRYEEMRAAGLYGTNALEAQLDLLYAYCQYDFEHRGAAPQLKLFRGINSIGEHEVLATHGKHQVVLFNNLTSFTASRERAGEFGDYILEVDVPAAKVFFHCGLMPGVLKGEDEHLVIGGVYEVAVRTF